jgi:hypothetical protein
VLHSKSRFNRNLTINKIMTDDTNVDAVVADEVVEETAPVAEEIETPVEGEEVAEEAPVAEAPEAEVAA